MTNVSGIGDCKITHNSLYNDPLRIYSIGDLGVRICHREYIQNVITGTANTFNLQSFPLNPGLPQVFPWLSKIAIGFEQYKINGMIWEFRSTSANALNSTNTALGSVIMATQYDSSRPVFQNQQQMANHEFANSKKQSCSILHAIECKKSLNPVSELWVRTGSIPSGDDERLYDFGLFQIATVGQQGDLVNIGELWVSYDVTFYKPQLIIGPTGSPFAQFNVAGDTPTTFSTGSTGTLNFNLTTTPYFDNGSNFSTPNFTVPATGVYYFEFSILVVCSSGTTYLYSAFFQGGSNNYGVIKQSFTESNTTESRTLTYSVAMSLNTGDTVSVRFSNTNGTVSVQDRSFSGFRVS